MLEKHEFEKKNSHYQIKPLTQQVCRTLIFIIAQRLNFNLDNFSKIIKIIISNIINIIRTRYF